MSRRRALLALGVAWVVAVTGCGGHDSGLPDQQAKSVDHVTRLTRWLGSIATTFAAGLAEVGSRLPSGVLSFGDCPQVHARREGLGLSIELDYGGGCNQEFIGGRKVVGAVSVGLDLKALEGQVGFRKFYLVGHEVDGAIGLKPVDGRLGRMRLNLRRLKIADVGRFQGDAALAVESDGSLAMEDGQVQMTELAGTDYGVRLSGVAINPLKYHNAIPDRGQLIWLEPFHVLGIDHIEVKVRFNAQSPRTGKVKVWLGPFGPYDYDLRQGPP